MDENQELDHQAMAIELCDGFTPHDHIALAAVSGDELVAQHNA